jgi:hypothetical protein
MGLCAAPRPWVINSWMIMARGSKVGYPATVRISRNHIPWGNHGGASQGMMVNQRQPLENCNVPMLFVLGPFRREAQSLRDHRSLWICHQRHKQIHRQGINGSTQWFRDRMIDWPFVPFHSEWFLWKFTLLGIVRFVLVLSVRNHSIRGYGFRASDCVIDSEWRNLGQAWQPKTCEFRDWWRN